jgi:hypothetical protein
MTRGKMRPEQRVKDMGHAFDGMQAQIKRGVSCFYRRLSECLCQGTGLLSTDLCLQIIFQLKNHNKPPKKPPIRTNNIQDKHIILGSFEYASQADFKKIIIIIHLCRGVATE